MSDEFFLSYVLPLVFLLVGIVLLTKAVRHAQRTRAFLTSARESTGEVIALEETPPQQPGADQDETYRPVVVFTAENGQRVRFESMASSNPPRYSVGDQVPVLYDPERPSDARIRSFHDLWFMPALLGGLGLAFTVVGAGLLTGMMKP